jgi:hypothetical protein
MKHLRLALLLFFLLTFTIPSYSQCSMCRAVSESGAKDETTKVGRGLNNGILYLLAMPYIIGGVAFYIWRKNRRKDLQP